jgi:hypothetical protein
MSETLFKVLLSELGTVRVKCLNPECLRVVEVTIDKLSSSFSEGVCPFCRQPFKALPHHGRLYDNLGQFAAAVQALQAAKDQIEISFVLRESADAKK